MTIGLKHEGKFGKKIKLQNGKEEYKDELLIVNFDDVSPKGIKFNRLHKTTWVLNLNILLITPKTKTNYNFTQLSRIRLWWSQSIIIIIIIIIN